MKIFLSNRMEGSPLLFSTDRNSATPSASRCGARLRRSPAASARTIAVRAILFRGAGQEAFASGADISEFKDNRKDRESAIAYNKTVEEAEVAIRDCPKPTVAMIFGFCMGGGMAIALACDLRFAAEGSRFGIPAAKLGIIHLISMPCASSSISSGLPMRRTFFTRLEPCTPRRPFESG